MKKGLVDKDTFFQLFLFKGEHKGALLCPLKRKGCKGYQKNM